MNGDVKIYYDFEQELSPAYAKKLDALCENPDDYLLWMKEKDGVWGLHRGFDGKYIRSPIMAGEICLTISQNEFVIKRKSEFTPNIEHFAEKKTLNKNTGVTFPNYKVVDYSSGDACGPFATYVLLLDEKPSKRFIKQLENSPKWTKNEDGTYCCEWGEANQYSERVTVDKNSRVIKAVYESYSEQILISCG